MDDEYVEMDHQVSEPTDDEIKEYAIWLGAVLPGDEDLLHIAREALVAPVPPPWKLFCKKDGESDPFYFNPTTGESLWDHPLDEHFKEVFAEEKRKKMNKMKSSEPRPAASLSGKSESKGKLKPLLSITSDSAPPISLGPLKGGNKSKNIALGSLEKNDGIASSQRIFTEPDTDTMKIQMKEEIVQLRAKYESEKQELAEKIRENSEETDKQKRLSERIRAENIKLEENLASLKKRHEGIVKQEEQRLKDSLKSLQNECQKETAKLKEELESAKKNAAKDLERAKKEDLDSLASGFETQRAMLIEQQETELENVKKEHREKMKKLSDELEKLRKDKEAEKEALIKEQNDLKRRREQVKKDLGDAMKDAEQEEAVAKMKSNFEQQKKELEQSFNKEMRRLRRANEAEKEALIKEQNDLKLKREQLQEQTKELEESSNKEIEKLKKAVQAQKDSLIKEQNDMKRERAEAEKEHNDAINSFNDLEKLSNLRASFETQKQDLVTQFNSEIETMKRKFEKKKQHMKKDQDEEINEMEQTFNAKLSKLKVDQSEQLKLSEMQSASTELEELRSKLNYKKLELQKQYQDEISELQDEHALEIEKQQRKYESEIQKMKISHESIIQGLELQLELAKNQIASRNLETKQYSTMTVEEEEEDYKEEPLMLVTKSTIISIKPMRKTKCRIGKVISFASPPANTLFHLTHRVLVDSAPLPITIPPTSLNGGFPDPPRAVTGPGAAPKISEITPLWNDDEQGKPINPSKTKKVLAKCEQVATELSDSIRSNNDEAKSALHTYKTFTMDERRRLNESSMDFQQQAAQFHRKLQSIISTVEVSLRSAVTSVNASRAPPVQYQPYIPPMPQSVAPHRRSRRRARVRDDTEEIEEEARRKLQNIRKEAAKRKPSPKRAKRKIVESDSYISD